MIAGTPLSNVSLSLNSKELAQTQTISTGTTPNRRDLPNNVASRPPGIISEPSRAICLFVSLKSWTKIAVCFQLPAAKDYDPPRVLYGSSRHQHSLPHSL
jgi:hypothetical protein